MYKREATMIITNELGTPAINTVHCCDVLKLLGNMASNSVNCVVTSPPYFGLRDYGIAGQIGLEETPQEYVKKLVELFREVKRVLRDDGTFWLNLGDTYTGGGRGGNPPLSAYWKQGTNAGSVIENRTDVDGIPSKSLLGIPWRVAFALQDDGWILRSEVIWHKPSCMPESVTDRPTKSHETIFLLAKAQRYWYDADAISEPAQDWGERDRANGKYHNPGTGLQPHSGLSGKVRLSGGNFSKRYAEAQSNHGGESERKPYVSRNKRSVWTVNTEPNSFAHFATFPTKLIEPMILAGCPDKVCAVCGAAWVREVEVSGGTIGKSWNNHEHDLDIGTSSKGHIKVMQDGSYQRKTLGFKPTCTCNADMRPGMVYDPFMGSGTTALVARRLGRNYIGSELNPDYVAIARERLRLPFEERYVKADDAPLTDLPLFARLGK